MEFLTPNAVSGDQFTLSRTDVRHFAGVHDPIAPETNRVGFRDSLLASLQDVNSHQKQAEQLSVQSIIDPDSVDPHDVTIAASKAQLSLSITKNVVDRVIQAYREITNLR